MTTIPAVYAAISACTSDLLSGIAKGKNNAQQGYKFRGIDDVYNTLAPVLARHKLVVLPRVTSKKQDERQTKSGGTMFYTHIEVEYDFVSAVDGSRHVVAAFGEAMDSADKSTNKAMSAAYKYMAIQAFCIPVENMADADAEMPEPSVRVRPIDLPDHNPTLAWVPAKDALKARIEAAQSTAALQDIRTSTEWEELVRAREVPPTWIDGLKKLAQARTEALA